MTREKFENLPVGETFVCGNIKLKVQEQDGDYRVCVGCVFDNYPELRCTDLRMIGIISECEREDDVIFIEVENETNIL